MDDVYIERMRSKTREGLDKLHAGVSQILFTDFPDHANVGDAAIALGQAAYWKEAGIALDGTFSYRTFRPDILQTQRAVVIQGGGNFGGLYPAHSEHRYMLSERLPAETMLIQAPQSVVFVAEHDREEFRARMASRNALRIGVRDRSSLAELHDAREVTLVPDSAHMLGVIDAPDPVGSFVLLLREDKETALRKGRDLGSIDWPEPTRVQRARQRLILGGIPGLPRTTWTTSPSRWLLTAEQRFRRGVGLLSQGETVITDRLHAMIIALQMGRRVIAIDNSVAKLTRYAQTWFDDLDPDLTFAESLEEALGAVH